MPTVAVAKFRQNKSLSRTLFAYTKKRQKERSKRVGRGEGAGTVFAGRWAGWAGCQCW